MQLIWIGSGQHKPRRKQANARLHSFRCRQTLMWLPRAGWLTQQELSEQESVVAGMNQCSAYTMRDSDSGHPK